MLRATCVLMALLIALVHFDADDTYSVVPVKKVAAKGELCAASNCTVEC